jgi:hypothetical protein
MNLPTVYDCALISLPKVNDDRGNLTFCQDLQHVPFDIRRVFYLYDIPGGSGRGAHAHKECYQFLVAVCGSFEVVMNDGEVRRHVQLNRPYIGLMIPPGIWAEEVNFSSGAICLVLASHLYDEQDYIRTEEQFFQWRKAL